MISEDDYELLNRNYAQGFLYLERDVNEPNALWLQAARSDATGYAVLARVHVIELRDALARWIDEVNPSRTSAPTGRPLASRPAR